MTSSSPKAFLCWHEAQSIGNQFPLTCPPQALVQFAWHTKPPCLHCRLLQSRWTCLSPNAQFDFNSAAGAEYQAVCPSLQTPFLSDSGPKLTFRTTIRCSGICSAGWKDSLHTYFSQLLIAGAFLASHQVAVPLTILRLPSHYGELLTPEPLSIHNWFHAGPKDVFQTGASSTSDCPHFFSGGLLYRATSG